MVRSDGGQSVCSRCGADLPKGSNTCWLCYANVPAPGDESVASRLEPPLPPRTADSGHEGAFSLASLMMFVTLVSVVLGTITIAPGVGIPLAVIALIVWARTVSVVRFRGSVGEPVRSSQVVWMFVRSIAMVLLLTVFIGVAAIAAFCVVCFASFESSPSSGARVAQIIALLVLVAALFAIAKTAQVERRRWRTDHRDPI